MAWPRSPGHTRPVKKLVLVGLLASFGCSSSDAAAPNDDAVASSDSIVGGSPDQRWPAAGYLVHGASLEEASSADVACGATLVAPNVVVTAAHCVLRAPDDVWAFGTGDARSATPIQVVSRTVHPSFHPVPQGNGDVRYFLHDWDLATLVLDHAADAEPARIPAQETGVGCSYSAIGYQKADGKRVSASACVELDVDLAGDPIFEVHPTDFSALCHADGDEGSAIVADGVLHGIYVGSVTQGFTDCHRGTQFLDGYEAMFGFRDFVQSSIDAAR